MYPANVASPESTTGAAKTAYTASRPRPPTSRCASRNGRTARNRRPREPPRPAARAPPWRPRPSRCGGHEHHREAGGRQQGAGQPDAGGPLEQQPAADRNAPSRQAGTAPSRRGEGHEPRACIRAGPAARASRSGAPGRCAPAGAPSRRWVVDLELHVLAGECDIHAARPVAAVDGDPTARQADAHRAGPRDSLRRPFKARGRG